MPVEITMPKLGLTMASGTIERWIKRTGEAVREGEPLVEVSTDKITYEVESPASGTVTRTLGADGDEFDCGAVIGLILRPGETDTPVTLNRPRAGSLSKGDPPQSNGTRTIASPAARRLARERGISLAAIRGTGPRGRVTLADVTAGHVALRQAPGPGPVQGDTGAQGGTGAQRDEIDVMLSLSKHERAPLAIPPSRRAIFQKMTEVGRLPLAQVETVAHVDAVRALMQQRRDFRWTAFAVCAVARLLRAHPVLRTDAATGRTFERIDIGVAADTPQGLIVPVVRDADSRDLAAIEGEIVRLAGLAREGKLGASDIGGACFSISNVGPQGIERVAPLPDPPQTAILGIGAATQRPAVLEGELRAAWMMTCVVSFDHRFIDGAPAARFLAALTVAYANPGALL